ncbi:hypothetical protein L873DRAFT_1848242 [Choiromyces venosus 120613-1]|uniref:Uncharacterized protein n=1 Tax=Choiromyces venosus 120613-1 TaxID=1336337 RepID=A0A3N4J2R2_9PEZI|nr:hypothetical protein L873DRAFT_1848242 [Choiromyces venosus 120613-1]
MPLSLSLIFGNRSNIDYSDQILTKMATVLRNNFLETKVLAIRQLYNARIREIMQNLERAPASVRFCKTCVLANRWPVAVSEMSAEEYERHIRSDLDEASELLEHNWDPRYLDRGFLDANIPVATRWFCSIDTRAKCHACGLGFDLVHVFDSSGEDTFPGEQRAAAEQHRIFCPIREVNGWRTDVTQTYQVSDYLDRFVDALNRGDDIIPLVGEDYYDEFIRQRLSRTRIDIIQRYSNRKTLAAQVLLKHCPKCLRASSTTLMGKRMHERVCQLTRFDWVTLAEVQPLRTQEGVDEREMVMNSNGSLERKFRNLSATEKERLEKKYQSQLYSRLNLDDRSLALLGDDNDSEDIPTDQDDRLIPRRRGRRRPHRRPIDSDNSDDENDYGNGRGGGRIVRPPIHPIPTLEAYNSWHAAMAPTASNGNINSTEQILNRFPMDFEEMLRQNNPIAPGAAAPQTRLCTKRLARKGRDRATGSELRALTGLFPSSTQGAAPDTNPPATFKMVQTSPQVIKVPGIRVADAERPFDPDPTPEFRRLYDEMPEAFKAAVIRTGLLNTPMPSSRRLLIHELLRPGWNAQAVNRDRRKKGQWTDGSPLNRTGLERYIDFFTNGFNYNEFTPSPVTFLDILGFSDAELEANPTFIEFLIPNDAIAIDSAKAQPMSVGFDDAIISAPRLAGCFFLGVNRIMEFWGFHFRDTSETGRPLFRPHQNFDAAQHSWTRAEDPHHTLIGRAIRSTRLAGAHRLSRGIYRCIIRLIRQRNFPVIEQTRRRWRRLALGPLERDIREENFPADAEFRTDSDTEEEGQTGDPRPGNTGGNNDDQGAGGGPPSTKGTFSHPGGTSLPDPPRRGKGRGNRRARGGRGGRGRRQRPHLPPTGDALVDSLSHKQDAAPPAKLPVRGKKRSSPFIDNGEPKRPRLPSTGDAAVDPPAIKWVQHSDPPSTGSPPEDPAAQQGNNDNEGSEGLSDGFSSSDSEGFLDPHERDEDFIPKRMPFFPGEPYFRPPSIQWVPPVRNPAQAPVVIPGLHKNSPFDDVNDPLLETDAAAAADTQALGTEKTAEGETPLHPSPRPKEQTIYIPPPAPPTRQPSPTFRHVEERRPMPAELARLDELRATVLRDMNPDTRTVVTGTAL